jgi:2'-5' RNA ligase
MRLFIAIEIPAEIKTAMAEIQQGLKNSGVDASWTRAEGIHLTLKFLGEVPEDRIPEIMDGLRSAVEGFGGFRLEVSGTGTFPNAKNARVVWVGLSGKIDALHVLQAAVEAAMIKNGFEQESKKFTPHLTLGRIKYIRSRDAWLTALDRIKNVTLPGFDVRAVSLMKSELKREGATYTEMGKIAL